MPIKLNLISSNLTLLCTPRTASSSLCMPKAWLAYLIMKCTVICVARLWDSAHSDCATCIMNVAVSGDSKYRFIPKHWRTVVQFRPRYNLLCLRYSSAPPLFCSALQKQKIKPSFTCSTNTVPSEVLCSEQHQDVICFSNTECYMKVQALRTIWEVLFEQAFTVLFTAKMFLHHYRLELQTKRSIQP